MLTASLGLVMAVYVGVAVASGLERWTGDRVGSNPAGGSSLTNFGNSVYPTLSFGGDTNSFRSLLSGVMPGEVKDPTQGANV